MDDREGARQHRRFDPARAALLDDRERFTYLPPGRVVALLDAAPGAVVCDFGTGTATYAIEVAQRRPDVRVVAFDEQPAMLERARAKIAPAALANIEVVGPAEIVAWRDGVDRVLAINVLHELGDAALASLGALLRTGGVALFVDWNAAVDRAAGPPNDHVYTPQEAQDRLARLGFACEPEAFLAYHYALRARRV